MYPFMDYITGGDYPCTIMIRQEVITHVPLRYKMNEDYFVEVKLSVEWTGRNYPCPITMCKHRIV